MMVLVCMGFVFGAGEGSQGFEMVTGPVIAPLLAASQGLAASVTAIELVPMSEVVSTACGFLPSAQVYGVRSSDTERYSPSVSWNNTADQIREMLTFNVSGFEQCIGNSESSVE